MALFKRRNDQSGTSETEVPAEIQEYYQAERRERAGLAWLLALGTLVVTVLLAVGLFFGGRWIYRKATHKTTSTVATSKPYDQSSTSKSSNNSSNQSSSSAGSSVGSNPSSSSQSQSGSSSTSTSSTSQPSSSSSSSGQANSNSNLPNTGPGNLIATFLVVSLITALVHNRLSVYKANK